MRIKTVTLKFLSITVIMLLAILACSLPGIPAPVTATETPATEMPTSIPLPSPTPDAILSALVPDLPVINNPSLLQIHMLDLMNGWGMTETSLVRTVDGGLTWYDMTPPGVSSLGYSTSAFFLDENTGWVVIGASDFLNGTLEITTDGGSSWSSVAVPFAGGQIDFINATTGFILVGRGAAAGSIAVDVYSSTDGGTTWVPVYVMQPGVGGDVNTLPFSGQKSGFTFLDSLHGWIGGSIPMDGNVYLYTSSDGGHVWGKQNIDLPSGYETAMTEVGSAQFFSGTDGVLPVRLMMEITGFDFYVTQDSGTTWISSSPLISNGQYSIATSEDFFVWDGGAVINVSHDGGTTWNSIATNINVADKLMKFEFVDTQTGWMLTGDAANHHSLYKTLDGGATWNVLIP